MTTIIQCASDGQKVVITTATAYDAIKAHLESETHKQATKSEAKT